MNNKTFYVRHILFGYEIAINEQGHYTIAE